MKYAVRRGYTFIGRDGDKEPVIVKEGEVFNDSTFDIAGQEHKLEKPRKELTEDEEREARKKSITRDIKKPPEDTAG